MYFVEKISHMTRFNWDDRTDCSRSRRSGGNKVIEGSGNDTRLDGHDPSMNVSSAGT